MLSSLHGAEAGEFHAVMVAGDPKAKPADSPTLRIDANTTTSPYAGVGSLRIAASSGTYICTATPIDATHVLTAGHCVDIDNNGVPDISGVTFNLNYGGDLTSQIPAVAWETHPNFTGFNSPSINDDLAVITLGAALPAGVPTYQLATSDMVAGTTHIYMVGYGRSGDGVKGYTTGASFTVKRDGENIVDAFYGQDDAAGTPGAKEVFRFDFDGPRPNTNAMGGKTLGNDKETTLGGGDSGGPSFVVVGGVYYLAGVNTFTQGSSAPKFGSLGGGINVFPYTDWIKGPHPAIVSTGGGVSGTSNSVLGSELFDTLESELQAASLKAPETSTAASADEQLSATFWVSATRSRSTSLDATARPAPVAAANASVDSSAKLNSALAGKAKPETTPDDTLLPQPWDSKSLDVIFGEWAEG